MICCAFFYRMTCYIFIEEKTKRDKKKIKIWKGIHGWVVDQEDSLFLSSSCETKVRQDSRPISSGDMSFTSLLFFPSANTNVSAAVMGGDFPFSSSLLFCHVKLSFETWISFLFLFLLLLFFSSSSSLEEVLARRE